MTKIKYIHCFGTSYTAGGGFEFNSVNQARNELLEDLYSTVDEKKTQFNFSWPGQLESFINNKNITIINHGKQGYGNDRFVRLSYEIINKKDFNPNENLFIIEFAGLGRDEFFFKEIQDYIVCNYQMFGTTNNKPNFKFVGAANSYGYDDYSVQKIIDNYDNFFNNYVDKFVDFEVNQSKLKIQADLFLSYLEKKKINFLFSITPILDYQYDVNKEIEFGDGKYFKKSNNFVKFIDDNNLVITNETSGLIQDGHGGFKANKIIGHIIYNKLVETNYIHSDIKPINWKDYYYTNFISK